MPPQPRKTTTPQASESTPAEVPAEPNGDDGGPKMAAVRAIVEAAETRIRTRVDTISRDLSDRLAGVTELLAEVQTASGDTAGTDPNRLGSIEDGLRACGEDVAKLNRDVADLATGLARLGESDAAGGRVDQMTSQALASMLDRIAGLENRANQAEASIDNLSAEMEAADAVINDELARHTADAVPAGSGQTYQPPEGQAILPAIWRVMREVEGIGKHGEMKQGERYHYRRWDDMAEALGAAFRRHGVMLGATITDRQYHHRQIKDGAQEWTSAYLTVRYRLTSLIDGSSVTFEAQGEGRDLTDKATRKAMTMALKAALDQAFLLGDAEDPDAERPGQEPDEVAPNVRASANETDAQRAAREAYERKLAERRRADQDTAAEAPQAAPAQTSVPAAEPAAAPPEATAVADPVASATTALSEGLGARPVEAPRDPWDVPPTVPAEQWPASESPSATTLAEQQNAALAAADEQEAMRRKAERAVRAYQAAFAPGVNLEKLNGIIAQANKEGLMSVQIQVRDEQKPLRSWLIAAGRTVAS